MRASARALGRHLEGWGLEPRVVSAAAEAVDVLRDAKAGGHPFDAVLLDEDLPDRPGSALAARLPRAASIPSTAILVLGGEPTTAGLRIPKPVRQSDLYDALLGISGVTPPRRDPGPVPLDLEGARGARVLVAEDHPTNQDLARALLERLGCAVEVVGTGREAVAASADGSFDLVLIDCQMPDLDGFEATRAIRLREGDGGDRLPIVALTANAMAGDRERCLEAGMDDHLAKPFTGVALGRVVERWRRSPAGDRSDAPTGDPAGEPPADAAAPDRDADLPTFDRGAALRRCSGDRELLARLAGRFADRLPEDLEVLRDALDRAEAATLGAEAHRIKGAAANLSADALSELARRLEVGAKAGDLADAPRLLAALERESEAYRRAVEDLDGS